MATILRGSCWRGAKSAYARHCGIQAGHSVWSKISLPLAAAPPTPSQHLCATIRRELSNKHTTDGASTKEKLATWWERFTAAKPMPPRHTAAWYREMLLVCTVFGITGSTTMVVVRPAVSDVLGIRGSLKDGPWTYRICSLVIMTPLYATLLVVVGTLFGRHAYFRHFTVKIFSRFGIPPDLMDANFHANAKNFRKW